VNRISPEAPVPVVEVQRRTFIVGGAANTAANVAALGGRVAVAGVTGDDAEGQRVRQLLGEQNIDTKAVIADATRPTTTKTRIVAHSQQMVRIDHEKPGAMTAEAEAMLLKSIQHILPTVRGCVISDYGKGVITPSFTAKLLALTREVNLPTVVDPKGTDYAKYRGATLVKPNQLEAGKVLNRDLKTTEDVERAGRDLLDLLGERSSVIITRGPHGMSIFERNKTTINVPTQAREVYDVTGAGDTVAGTLALCLAVGSDLATASHLASLAAAVVVGKVGTATCSLDELRGQLVTSH